MCSHSRMEVVEDSVMVEEWEGDLYVQNEWQWVVCMECGDDFSCKLP